MLSSTMRLVRMEFQARKKEDNGDASLNSTLNLVAKPLLSKVPGGSRLVSLWSMTPVYVKLLSLGVIGAALYCHHYVLWGLQQLALAVFGSDDEGLEDEWDSPLIGPFLRLIGFRSPRMVDELPIDYDQWTEEEKLAYDQHQIEPNRPTGMSGDFPTGDETGSADLGVNYKVPSASIELGKFKISPAVQAAMMFASKEFNIPLEEVYATVRQESGFNPRAGASTSSARGLFQFISSTWNELRARYPKIVSKYGIGAANGRAFNDDRMDPVKSAVMFGLFRNANALALGGLTSGDRTTDMYIAHFAGAGGASTVLRALKVNPGLSIRSVLGDKAYESNRSLMSDPRGNPLSVKSFVDRMFQKSGAVALAYQSQLGLPKTASALSTSTQVVVSQVSAPSSTTPRRVEAAPTPKTASRSSPKGQPTPTASTRMSAAPTPKPTSTSKEHVAALQGFKLDGFTEEGVAYSV